MNRSACSALFTLALGLPASAHAEEPATPSPFEPTSSPAPAARSSSSDSAATGVVPELPREVVAQRVDRPSVDRRDANTEAFTARRGFRMTTAGLAFMALGTAQTSVGSWMMHNDDPRLGLALTFAIEGAVMTSIGLAISSSGARRARRTSDWLARRDGRRERLESAASSFDMHSPADYREQAVVQRGGKMRRVGALVLATGIFGGAFGGGLSFAYGNGHLAPRIAVPVASLSIVITGAALLAAGGRRMYHSDRFVERRTASRRKLELVAAPQLQRGGMGIALSGRF
ncbi:MAG TPA: hypothetical protein VG755_13385 [Nannocystaceae bacterium]|nr:hypothetical protein [Nannocystaceae bacterium]